MTKKTKSLADQLFPIEAEEDELAVVDIPPERRRLHTETYDFSIATIVQYLEKQNIFIPTFQRKYVWSRSQASRLIESLIIQCPIPVIYLNQERDERLAVIDGNQRITSIDLFLKDEFALQGLTAYPELDGSFFSDLDPRIKRHIQNRTLRCITILKETHPQIKIDVFERLNTGAVQLNPQEVRHGIYHGPMMALIDDLCKEKIWQSISGIKQDDRMKGAELILRFFSLLFNQNEYKKPLKGFLNAFSEKNANLSDVTVLKWKRKFLSTVESINLIFERRAFRVLNAELEPSSGNINAALFDAVMVATARVSPTREQIEGINKKRFLRKYYDLLNDEHFKMAIESGTSATTSVNTRISMFENFLSENIS